jgi:hypothetical protein
MGSQMFEGEITLGPTARTPGEALSAERRIAVAGAKSGLAS